MSAHVYATRSYGYRDLAIIGKQRYNMVGDLPALSYTRWLSDVETVRQSEHSCHVPGLPHCSRVK